MKKPKHAGYDPPFIDAEEEELIRAFEGAAKRGELKSMPRAKAVAMWQGAVRNTLKKKPITVRVQEQDIQRIKVKAMEQGIPYQTLVSSILHRYASGRLKEEA